MSVYDAISTKYTYFLPHQTRGKKGTSGKSGQIIKLIDQIN